MAKYLRPRRGKKSTAESQKIVLKRGEVFFECPDTGVGTGAGKIKVGDGTTEYADLPYFSESDDVNVENSTIAFAESTETSNDTLLNTIASGATLKVIIGAIKKMLRNLNTSNTTISTTLKQKADSNHTHSTGTEEESGMTKLYSTEGDSTDGTMTRAAITTALSGKSSVYHYHDGFVGERNSYYNNSSKAKLVYVTISDADVKITSSTDGTLTNLVLLKVLFCSTYGSPDASIVSGLLTLDNISLSGGSTLRGTVDPPLKQSSFNSNTVAALGSSTVGESSTGQVTFKTKVAKYGGIFVYSEQYNLKVSFTEQDIT